MDTAWRIEQLAHCFAKPVLISLIILGFAFHWHLGLAVLALACFGGLLFWKRHAYAHWGEGWCRSGTRWGPPGWSSDGGPGRNGNGCGGGGNGGRRYRGRSGNRAFDEYREETLRRLEEEQKEFEGFLERLRIAKDKAEFDAFLAERRRAAPGGSPPEAPPQI